MQQPSPDAGLANGVPLRARIANRLARSIRTTPVKLASATPLVSFTFDDAPQSACLRGAGMLDDAGAQGTFYVSGGLLGSQTRHWRLADEMALAALHGNGHEIGCHTYSHIFLPGFASDLIERDLLANQARLGAIVPGLRLESFAFPFGYGSLSAKRVLRSHYSTSRTILPGLNVGRVDAHYLRANPLIEGALDAGAIARLMDAALAGNGWLIFYGHDVAEDPSPYGCSPALLDAALRAATERRIPCVSVAEGFRRALQAPVAVGEAQASCAV